MQREMLGDAVAKAQRLVADLERDAADMAKPSSIPANQLTQGRESIDRALAAARKMLQALQRAGEGAGRE